MHGPVTRVLVVDDYAPWRHYVSSLLQKQRGLQVVGEVSDGAEAVEKCQRLQPHLILLDISLPHLNGIEAARKIRRLSSDPTILFVSANRSPEIIEEALRTGGAGYVLKSHAASDLLPALQAVLQGRQFVSPAVAIAVSHKMEHSGREQGVPPFLATKASIRHEVAFYPDDAALADGFSHFATVALKSGSLVILITTDAHRTDILKRMRKDAIAIEDALQEKRCIFLGVDNVFSGFATNGPLDPVGCAELVGDLIMREAKTPKRENLRVSICGEGAPALLAMGYADTAIQLEHLWNEIAQRQEADTLCGYLWSQFPEGKHSSILEKICAEHSAVHWGR